jgi:hypothetical protein
MRLGITLNNGVPVYEEMRNEISQEQLAEWFRKQDYVFEKVNGEWKLVTKEEFISLYDEHVENTTRIALRMLEGKVKAVTKQIEFYEKFRKEFLNDNS